MLKDELPKIITDTLPGEKSKEVLFRRKRAIPNAIGTMYPVVIKRAEGAIVEDLDGNRFVDFVGGVGVLNLGYSNKEIIDEVKKQSDLFFHSMFNITTHESYVKLAEEISKLAKIKGTSKKAYFANSGAEAIENAIKCAKAYTKRNNIIVFSGAFHGRTYYTMTMTSKKAYAKDMGVLASGVFRAEYPYLYRKNEGLSEEDYINNCIDSIYKIFEECAEASTIAAIVLEPLQGEGGFIPAPIEFVKKIREICDEYGILLIADEVQAGWCRCGEIFATYYWTNEGIYPDILATAKSIAAGIPLSAIVAREEIMDRVPMGVIGGTYCGNPLACAAALKVIEIIKRDKLDIKSQMIGELVMNRYKQMQEKYPIIGDIRGLGAMIGIEFVTNRKTKKPAQEFTKKLIEKCVMNGLIIEGCGTYNNTIRFLAPLVITKEQLECGLDIFENALKELENDYLE